MSTKPDVTKRTVIFPTHCDKCQKKLAFENAYVTNFGPHSFHFCSNCAKSSQEALKLQKDIILSTRPKAPGVRERE